MPSASSIAPPLQPRARDYRYDLDRALNAVVQVTAMVPPEAATADVFGTTRTGSGTCIREAGLILTPAHLLVDAVAVTLAFPGGQSMPGEIVGCDHEAGFGLVRVGAPVGQVFLQLGDSDAAKIADHVVIAASGGVPHTLAARIANRQPFAGHWEYVLEQAILTTPAHPRCVGAAAIGAGGDLIGIASIEILRARPHGPKEHLNLVVPIDLLKPVLDELLAFGRPKRAARPWLGIYAIEIERRAIVAELAPRGPAQTAGLHKGDAIVAVGGYALRADTSERVGELFRKIWSLGHAGVTVPLTVERDGHTFEVRVRSADRERRLEPSRLH